MAQLCAVGPHAQLAQPLKLTGICGGGPLLAFACPLSPHTFLSSLSTHLLCTGLKNYYLQCRLRKTNSFEKCLQEPFLVFAQLLALSKLGSFNTHTEAKGANLQNIVFAQFPGRFRFFFVTSKNETTNSPIHEFNVLHKGQRAF